MDSEEAPAQRPVTLEITVEDVTTEAPGPDPPKLTISQTPLRENLLPQGESIDLGGEFSTPGRQQCYTFREPDGQAK
ncbi:hypothetical protein F7725_007795 [Dissostichus mawsoni]|uniref:Uncharacterized protein n=1 Tax=Dissostichus mawsoni TaxID=36200 RepID=A0A7J5Y5E2_DISMA|nr:hypothetical protein F7725_007795 [Dissostichus mawsoni]